MGSISLCLTASRDEAAVRALLELMRPVVDEVVLGVDARAAERILAACGDLVDQAYAYEYETTVEQYVAWMYERCTGEWILRLDDDEAPSAALLAALPELARDRRRSLLLLPMRDLYPTRERYIVSHPWYPDYHARLIRNLPGLWSFAGTPHREIEALGERRRIPEAPLYHLHFAQPDTDERLAAARRREEIAPGIMTEAFPVNAVSLPEYWSGVRTAAVPDEDRAAIEAVADPAPVARDAGPRPAPELIPGDEAKRLLLNRTVRPDAYAAEIEISPMRRHLLAGTIAHIEVHVRNRGGEHWPPAHEPEPPIRLAYRLLASDGTTVVEPEGLRTPFEQRVLPGERAVAMLAVQVPDVPGEYVLEVDVVHELVRWFDCAARLTVSVEPLEPAAGDRSAIARPELERLPLDAGPDGLAAGR
jgi:hypothetical protein